MRDVYDPAMLCMQALSCPISNRNVWVNGGLDFLTTLSVSNMELSNWFLFVMNVRIKIARDFGAKMNHDYDNVKSKGCVALVMVCN